MRSSCRSRSAPWRERRGRRGRPEVRGSGYGKARRCRGPRATAQRPGSRREPGKTAAYGVRLLECWWFEITRLDHARRNEKLKSHGTTRCRPWHQGSKEPGRSSARRRRRRLRGGGRRQLLAVERPNGCAQRRLLQEPRQHEGEDRDERGDDEYRMERG